MTRENRKVVTLANHFLLWDWTIWTSVQCHSRQTVTLSSVTVIDQTCNPPTTNFSQTHLNAVFSIRDAGKNGLLESRKFSGFLTSCIPLFIP